MSMAASWARPKLLMRAIRSATPRPYSYCWRHRSGTQFFLAATNDISLPSSRDAAEGIHKLIKEHTNRLKPHVKEPDYNEELGDYFVKRLKEEIEAFELLFERESRRISVFIVRPKGLYDTEKLIEAAEKRFPQNLLDVMPQSVIDDLREAGKCFAFDLPTACAFHVCRATEGLMRTYYKRLTGNDWPPPALPPKKPMGKNWAVLVDQLRVEGASAKVIQRLGEIREDRNSFAHPDVTVPQQEAPTVFDLCTGAMFLMAQEIALTP